MKPMVYPKKCAHGFVVLCFVVVMQSLIMYSHEVFIHIHQGCFAGTGAIVRLPQCQWSKPDGYGKISQCKTTTKHSKAKTLCIFLGIYSMVFLAEGWIVYIENSRRGKYYVFAFEDEFYYLYFKQTIMIIWHWISSHEWHSHQQNRTANHKTITPCCAIGDMRGLN